MGDAMYSSLESSIKARLDRVEILILSLRRNVVHYSTSRAQRIRPDASLRNRKPSNWAEITKDFAQLSREIRTIRSAISCVLQLADPLIPTHEPSEELLLPHESSNETTMAPERLTERNNSVLPPFKNDLKASPTKRNIQPTDDAQCCATDQFPDVEECASHDHIQQDASEPLANATAPGPPSSALSDRSDTSEALDRVDESRTISTKQFALKSSDHGKKLMPALARLVRQPGFQNIVYVPKANIDFATFENELSMKDADCTSTIYVAGLEGTTHLFADKNKRGFKWPTFTTFPTRPTYDEMENFLEASIRQPPANAVPYFCGASPSSIDAVLHPGEQLSEFKSLTIANTQYYHIGGRGSATAFHREDAGFWSLNQVDFGWKIWIVIPIQYTAIFERFIKNTWETCECDQFVRHASLLITPSRLLKEGIKPDIRCTGPGEMFITQPGQYHAVVNFSASFSRSINALLPDEPLFPKQVTVCEDCGLFPLHRAHGFRTVAAVKPQRKAEGSQTHKRKLAEEAVKTKCSKRQKGRSGVPLAAERMSRAKNPYVSDTQKVSGDHVNEDSRCKLPFITPSNMTFTKVDKLAAAVRSRIAIRQFVALVEAWRAQGIQEMGPMSQDPTLRIEQRVKLLKASVNHSALAKLVVRVNQLRLYQDIEASKLGRLRADTAYIRKLCASVGWQKHHLDYHRLRGKKWAKICGNSYEGLLCFIVLTGGQQFDITCENYLCLSSENSELEEFHRLVDNPYTLAICSAGQAFQEALAGEAFVRFYWEDHINIDWDALPEQELVHHLQPDKSHVSV